MSRGFHSYVPGFCRSCPRVKNLCDGLKPLLRVKLKKSISWAPYTDIWNSQLKEFSRTWPTYNGKIYYSTMRHKKHKCFFYGFLETKLGTNIWYPYHKLRNKHGFLSIRLKSRENVSNDALIYFNRRNFSETNFSVY